MRQPDNMLPFAIFLRPLAALEYHSFRFSCIFRAGYCILTAFAFTENSKNHESSEDQGTVDSCGMYRFYKEGRLKEAVGVLYLSDQECAQADSYAYSCLLQGCIDMKALVEGKRVHSHMIKTGFKPGVYLQNRIVDMYGKCGKLADARQMFDKMPLRDVFSWTIMITKYANCGRMNDAHKLFDKMPERNAVSWNAMIAGYAQGGHGEEGLKLFWKMQQADLKPDRYIFASVLSACAGLAAADYGKKIHAQMLRAGFESDVSVCNALITMYVHCGNIDSARKLFDQMAEQDLVSWNAMIAGYAQHGHGKEVLQLFGQIKQTGVKPDHSTLASVLCACASSSALEQGKQVHADIVKNGFNLNLFVGSSLVDMYAKCASIEDACQVFEEMPKRNVVSWTAMVVGFAQSGRSEEALKLFCQMLQDDERPNHFTLASALSACATLAAMDHGKQIHAQIIIAGFESDVSVGNALVMMYAKCGTVDDAQNVFSKMPVRNVVSWNTMVVGYAHHGRGKEALHLFEQMLCTGMKPNDITFVGVLSACDHAGLVDEGWYYLDSMSREHYILPRAKHYVCMIDLLGRAGHLDKAENFIKNMPVEPNADAWRALLGACTIHGNLDLAKHAAECLLELEPENDASYVLMSNLYAVMGRWHDAAEVRKMMKERGIKKEPGCSWIEVRNKVHAFVAEDRAHPQREEIYEMLQTLAGHMKEAGYVPCKNFGLPTMGE